MRSVRIQYIGNIRASIDFTSFSLLCDLNTKNNHCCTPHVLDSSPILV